MPQHAAVPVFLSARRIDVTEDEPGRGAGDRAAHRGFDRRSAYSRRDRCAPGHGHGLSNCRTPTQHMASGLGIYGAGGAGREIAWLARVCLGPNVHIRFIVDNPATQASTINGLDVVTFDQFLASTPNVPVTIAIGDAASRERISETCKAAGLRFQTLIHPGVILSPFVSVGEGSIICEGCVLTTNIEIGRHVYV